MQDESDLVGRIAGMAVTKLDSVGFATGVYFKATEVVGGEVKAVCTNPGLRMDRTFPVQNFRRQLQQETIEGQLQPLEAEQLDYAAKCYQTKREDGENDEHLKARLTAIGLGPSGLN
ncbi:hypothetical protein M2222_001373 [Bradyrhizobium elkanii]|uniref:hypothetical protein n=1 Tax=Bradyrhizobium elkanii TaxID=29448 RepID=UPI0021680657|nr:hypothetical protein [Bradyrhizobium elkanii]MCS3449806.1 hypothetical protein [Bradyrhizobium elkanii]MCS3559051.1 hypothetical protein [Bradyrhizobium elkanii]MCW2151103.1 hypothetical protein [Bradyrhizobium elkanii]MCW2374834.1 hypothetical protein [Bradyrhizobium elkanii]